MLNLAVDILCMWELFFDCRR